MNTNTPITVITGFLGSGKTTLINALLNQKNDTKIALLINDLGEINIDASLIAHQSVLADDQQIIELTNGCICCTLREDLLQEVSKLLKEQTYDALWIEASGMSEPTPIIETLLTGIDEEGTALSSISTIDAVVSVVDSYRLYHEYHGGQDLSQALEEGDLLNLIVEQIEVANILCLNKIDLLSAEQLAELRAIIEVLQPTAKIIECIQGNIPISELTNTHRFSIDDTFNGAGWIKTLDEHHDHEGEHTLEDHLSEFGVNSFIFSHHQPFNPARIAEFLNDFPENCIRAKGYFWVATQPDTAFLLSQAGPSITVTPVGNWLVSLSEAEQKETLAENPELLETWDETYGDRINELVFIGKSMDQETILATLNEALQQEGEAIDPTDDPFQPE